MAKPGNVSQGGVLKVYCPKCGDEMQHVIKKGAGSNGLHVSCKKCDFCARYRKRDYLSYEHKFVK